MSRHNKVNPDHYTIAGRLTPDDLARERHKQGDGRRAASRQKPAPPWTQTRAATAPARAGVANDAPAKSEAGESEAEKAGTSGRRRRASSKAAGTRGNTASQPRGTSRRRSTGRS
jgi:hypothetical protein